MILELVVAASAGGLAGFVASRRPVIVPPVVEGKPYAVPVITPTVSPEATDRYTVTRDVDGHRFVLYDGVSGGEAKRAWESVKFGQEPGSMTFTHNGVLRDTWSND